MNKGKKNYGLIISIVVLVLVLAFAVYIVLYKRNFSNFKLLALIIGLLVMTSILAVINQIRIGSKKSEFNILNSVMVLVFGIGTFFLINTGKTVARTENLVPNFIGKNISEAVEWASKNKVELVQTYEFSDSFKENNIFAQDQFNIDVKEIEKLNVTISNGINYDKTVVLSSYVGQDISLLLNDITDLHLNNVKIDYEVNDYNQKGIVLTQSVSGEIRRNEEVKIVVSLGKKSELSEITMISLVGKNIFDATLYLEQNGINYEIKYDFSNENKDVVISQSVKENEIIKPFDTKVILTVSKGNKILVPDLTKMTISEVIKWITDNNLKIELTDAYNNKIEAGKVISANYKENEEISEGTLVKVTTSKGALKMLSFKSLSEFRKWANTYNVKYEEEYEFNNNVSKGNIIKFSLSPNDLIDENVPIIVTISNGKAVTIPNYVGKSKSEITSSCKNIGLSCSFTYGSYSTTSKDVAVSQNKKAGSSVISGTSLIITLSKGTAKTFTVQIFESQLTLGNASATANTLKTYFAKNYPDVNFVFSYKKSNTYPRAGYIHENSQVKDGTKVTQGKTYNVIITSQ